MILITGRLNSDRSKCKYSYSAPPTNENFTGYPSTRSASTAGYSLTKINLSECDTKPAIYDIKRATQYFNAFGISKSRDNRGNEFTSILIRIQKSWES